MKPIQLTTFAIYLNNMESKLSYTDQCGEKIDLSGFPSRIISLVPSQTELLFSLGLNKEVIGITKFCIHPLSWFKSKVIVGGTKVLNMQKIDDLKPDLIIANKEENDKEQILELREKYPLWTSDIISIEDSLDMIRKVGELVGRKNEALELVHRIQSNFLLNKTKENKKLRTAYLIWQNPLMTINSKTFIHAMLSEFGMENIYGDNDSSRYPEISMEQLQNDQPELLILSSEPFPFGEKHRSYFAENLPECKVILADGEMFSWYGSRMVDAADYIKNLLLN
jgi:ABC-type Fe3+-hydroxamate transport system substrate-binding protein